MFHVWTWVSSLSLFRNISRIKYILHSTGGIVSEFCLFRFIRRRRTGKMINKKSTFLFLCIKSVCIRCAWCYFLFREQMHNFQSKRSTIEQLVNEFSGEKCNQCFDVFGYKLLRVLGSDIHQYINILCKTWCFISV